MQPALLKTKEMFERRLGVNRPCRLREAYKEDFHISETANPL